MTPVSAVLIAKNEESHIGRCLDSLAGLGQVVVYDTGSTDRTREVAAAKGALVIDAGSVKPFHFANARNAALEHASSNWVLTIDADEVLDEGGVGVIRKVLSDVQEAIPFMAVSGTHLNFSAIDGKETVMPTSRTLLFRKDRWVWRYRVHERLFPASQTPSILGTYRVPKPKNVPELKILHRRQGLQPGKDERIALLKLAIREAPEYPFLRLQLGLEHLLREEWGLAVVPLQAYIHSRQFEGVMGKAVAYMQLGRARARIGDLQGSMDAFLEASAAAPTRREPRYWAAIELIHVAMPWEAIPWLEEALKIAPKALPEFALYSEEAQGILIQETLDACRAMIEEAKRKFREQGKAS